MAIIPEVRKPARDEHDAAIRFVETVLSPLSPSARMVWVREWLPKTFTMTVADRDFEVLGRTP